MRDQKSNNRASPQGLSPAGFSVEVQSNAQPAVGSILSDLMPALNYGSDIYQMQSQASPHF